jgi:hypothetical protein
MRNKRSLTFDNAGVGLIFDFGVNENLGRFLEDKKPTSALRIELYLIAYKQACLGKNAAPLNRFSKTFCRLV